MDNFDYIKYLAKNRLHENMFDVATTEKIAQAVADAFTADDDLDLKYVINPRIDAGHFDLDVEAGPNTPGEDWKDVNGFSIDNYLGDLAGGSFYIKDGVVYNAASKNAPVANVSPEGEVEMISAEDSRAEIGLEENKNENKTPNKMKKSELKEMIKAAMMAETSVAEAEKVDVNDEENVDVEDTENVDVDVEKDVKVDDTESEVDVDVTASMPGESEDVEEVQALLMKAQEAAKGLGDEKLTDQIGNTITYFTRSHVSRVAEMDFNVDDVAMDTEMEAGLGLEEETINEIDLNVTDMEALLSILTGVVGVPLSVLALTYAEDGIEAVKKMIKGKKAEVKEDTSLQESLRMQKLAGIIK